MKILNNISNFRRIDLYGDGYVGDEYSGAFVIDRYKNGEFYLVIADRGDGWDHVSVSLHRKNGANIKRCPSFEEMMMIKEKTFEENEIVFQLHPTEEEYINTHPFCLHLWKPNSYDMIIPPLNLVSSDNLKEVSCFVHDGIIVRIKTGEFEEWQVARVYCFTKDGKMIKTTPSWDIMCEAKSLIFGDKNVAFQFMSSLTDKHIGLDIWCPKNLDLISSLPDSKLVGYNKKSKL